MRLEGSGDTLLAESSTQQRCRMGQLKRADGSSSFSCGGTYVWASVFGPGNLRASKQSHQAAILDVYLKPKIINQGKETDRFSSLEYFIRDIIEGSVLLKNFPRAHVVLTMQEMETDGSLGSAAINAACLALLDSGIPMKNVFCGVTLAVVGGRLEVEPSGSKERDAQALFTMAFKLGNDKSYRGQDDSINAPELCGISTAGTFLPSELLSAREIGQSAASSVFDLYRTAVRRKCFAALGKNLDDNDDLS